MIVEICRKRSTQHGCMNCVIFFSDNQCVCVCVLSMMCVCVCVCVCVMIADCVKKAESQRQWTV